ncbi:MAG: diaminopimelate decarboxylase [Clostridia bacterium]
MNFRETLNINEQGHLQIGGVDTVALATKFGTPLYVMDEAYIRGVIRAFKGTIEANYGLGNIAYASKAFSCQSIYKIAKQENICVDVVSAGELFTALSVGFNAKNILFHGNNKTEEEMVFATNNGVGTFVVDSLDEIEILNDIALKKGIVQNVLIRANPGVEAHTHSFIQTAKIDSKFGFSIANGDALFAIKTIVKTSNLHFLGIHCHIGSQIFDTNAFVLAVDVMTDFIVELNSHHIEVEQLNMGGGFGVHYTEDDPKYSVNEYCNYVKLLLQTLNNCIAAKRIKKPYFLIEPGRSIVGEAGITLYTVGAIKEIKNVKKYVNIDGGMVDNIRPALYDAKYEALIANRANEPLCEKVSIAGKCCESGDVIIKDIMLPKAKRGDILAVFTTGAYNYSMAMNYNRNFIPPVVLVCDGNSDYAVKPQSFNDLIRNDNIPTWLK